MSYAGVDSMLLLVNGIFTMGKSKSSLLSYNFPLNWPSLSISRCSSSYEADIDVSVVSFIVRSMGYMRQHIHRDIIYMAVHEITGMC